MKNPFSKVFAVSFCVFFVTSLLSFSQNETDEHALIHFDNGVGFFYAPDNKLSMNIRLRMQNRIYLATESENIFNSGILQIRVIIHQCIFIQTIDFTHRQAIFSKII